jgi:hypothetical protein
MSMHCGSRRHFHFPLYWRWAQRKAVIQTRRARGAIGSGHDILDGKAAEQKAKLTAILIRGEVAMFFSLKRACQNNATLTSLALEGVTPLRERRFRHLDLATDSVGAVLTGLDRDERLPYRKQP